LTAWRALATSGDRRVREAALELLGEHEEIASAASTLAVALESKELGIVATAADVLAKHPERAADEAPRAPKRKKGKKKRDKNGDAKEPEATTIAAPSAAVVAALLAAIGRPEIDQDPEIVGSLADAVGALALKEARPRLEALCKSTYPTNREHAE